MPRTYVVTLHNAAGVACEYLVTASRESTACGFAVRRLERETGERWYAVRALAQ